MLICAHGNFLSSILYKLILLSFHLDHSKDWFACIISKTFILSLQALPIKKLEEFDRPKDNNSNLYFHMCLTKMLHLIDTNGDGIWHTNLPYFNNHTILWHNPFINLLSLGPHTIAFPTLHFETRSKNITSTWIWTCTCQNVGSIWCAFLHCYIP